MKIICSSAQRRYGKDNVWVELHIIPGTSIQKDYQINHELSQEKKGATSGVTYPGGVCCYSSSLCKVLILSWKKQLSLNTFSKFYNPHHSEKLSDLFHPNETTVAYSVRQYMKYLQINK